MHTSLSMALERLTQDALLSLHDAQGHGVAVFSGRLWVTQEGDAQDHFVDAGESFYVDRPGHVVMHALSDTQLLRLAASARRSGSHAWQRAGGLTTPPCPQPRHPVSP